MGGDLVLLPADQDLRRRATSRPASTESVTHAWYEGGTGRSTPGKRTMPKPQYTDFQEDGKYSWVKAPRFEGKPMQVGPLAQILDGLRLRHELITKQVNESVGLASSIAKVQISLTRCTRRSAGTLARAIRCAVQVDELAQALGSAGRQHRQGRSHDLEQARVPEGRDQGRSASTKRRAAFALALGGDPRRQDQELPGGRAFDVERRPRDEADAPGAYEASLAGTPVAIADQPLEVLRTVHSFDPCLACAVHVVDQEKRPVVTVRAL
jgi:hydrogenase large subunit